MWLFVMGVSAISVDIVLKKKSNLIKEWPQALRGIVLIVLIGLLLLSVWEIGMLVSEHHEKRLLRKI